jgi:hypothetical protein
LRYVLRLEELSIERGKVTYLVVEVVANEEVPADLGCVGGILEGNVEDVDGVSVKGLRIRELEGAQFRSSIRALFSSIRRFLGGSEAIQDVGNSSSGSFSLGPRDKVYWCG